MQITLKTLENDFLAGVHSISLINMEIHFSQDKNVPESQNPCEVREAAMSHHNQDDSPKLRLSCGVLVTKKYVWELRKHLLFLLELFSRFSVATLKMPSVLNHKNLNKFP